MKKIVIAVLLLAAPGIGAADPPVARLVNVSGNVLVSSEFNIASAGEALRLVPGMRVIATQNSSAIVEYAGGCRVRVLSGERLEIRAAGPCEPVFVRQASVRIPASGQRP